MATELVDAHTHVACPGYPEAGRALALNTSQWWESGGDEPSLAAALDGMGVSRCVVVQAIGLYGFDCRCAAATVAAGGGRYALVVAVDMNGADPVADVAAMAGSMPVAGVRLMGILDGTAPWVADGRGDAVCDALEEYRLSAVPCIFGGDLPALGELASRHRVVPIALDHCGFTDMGPPESVQWLLELAQVPNIHLKVSSHNLDQPGDPAAFVDRVAEAFGTDRLCWGSDHPQHSSLTYPQLVDLARQASRNLDEAGREAFLGANSLRLWWPR